MSFWKSLFGGGSSEGEAKPSAPIEYNGFPIRAAPYKSEGQYQTAGSITKEIGGVTKEHRFIRAVRHAAYDDAIEFSLGKGRPIGDQQGGRARREDSRPTAKVWVWEIKHGGVPPRFSRNSSCFGYWSWGPRRSCSSS